MSGFFMSKSKVIQAKYENLFMVAERHHRRKVADWKNIIQELHADRGMLLGSSQFTDMSGVEQYELLKGIDTAIYDCHKRIDEIEELRNRAVPEPFGYKYRARVIRRKVLALDDEALGVEE